MGKDWNIIDKFIARLRYRKLNKFIPRNGIACDIGCGMEGYFLKSISKKIQYGYGFDMKVKNKIEGNIELINNSDVHGGLNVQDNSIDAVFLIAVLEHLDEPEILFSEVHRILKPNGIFVLTTPSKISKPILEFMAYNLKIISRDEILDHKYYYNKEEIFRLYKKEGFKTYNYKYFLVGLNQLSWARK